jgi:hypothetical protein
MNIINILELDDYILSFLDYQDLGKLYVISKYHKQYTLNAITNKYKLTTYLNKYTCYCNICDRLYDTPMILKPKKINDKTILLCPWSYKILLNSI